MSQNIRPRILIAHPWMGKGGSEATAMWMLQALQDDARVTLVTASEVDLENLNAIYGTSISAEKIVVRRAPRLPGVRRGNQLVHLQNGLFERFCRKIAPGFDLCASAYNPIDFGRPGIQMIGDLSFSEELRLELYPVRNFYHRQSLLRRIYLTAGDALRGRKRPTFAERGDLAVANSQWVADLMRRHFKLPELPVAFPPVRLPGARYSSRGDRNPFGFVWLGRISPEKKVQNLITILSKVRRRGFPVELTIGGQFTDSEYCGQIRRQIAAEGSWIRTPGFLDAAEKKALLAAQLFSLHCNEVEPFGIAVAEMAAAGCLPVVPAMGGASEIITVEELQFEDPDQAVEKIAALLEDPEKSESLRAEVANSIDRFSEAEFMKRFRHLAKDGLEDPAFTRNQASNLKIDFSLEAVGA